MIILNIIFNFVFYLFCFKKTDDAKKNVNRDYVKKLKRRYNALSTLRDEYCSFSLPVHVITIEARCGSRQWDDVELLLSKFPPHMAKQALMWRDDDYECCPLHFAAWKKPRSTIVKMLELAPESARVQGKFGWLPLHFAIYTNNVTAVELLTRVYPRGLFVKDYENKDPISLGLARAEILCAIIGGLLNGLSNDALRIELEVFPAIISKLIIERYGGDIGAVFVSRHLRKFINLYENKVDCNVCEMLLMLYCMATETTDVLDMSSSIEDVLGNHLGMHTLSMAVEYRLLDIIKQHESHLYRQA